MFPALKFWMLTKFDFSSKKGVLVVKFAFANSSLKIETLRMRRRFARVLSTPRVFYISLVFSGIWPSCFLAVKYMA